ncbi:MAG: hypothetical protein Q7R66_08275 [Undibacterium sp.]|uniref:hypothetical protein n=1 Tax=Undibacterium sp. TaxID=1914977 RepID=UPI0027256D9E|nr:hypothetical protein [Undibacterium sp.]MDO8652169.1 hypothetical protein [Undibacterium sp.]
MNLLLVPTTDGRDSVYVLNSDLARRAYSMRFSSLSGLQGAWDMRAGLGVFLFSSSTER